MNAQLRNRLEDFIGDSVLVWPPSGSGRSFDRYDVVLVKKTDKSGLLAPTQLNLMDLRITEGQRQRLVWGKSQLGDNTPKTWQQTISKNFAAQLAAGIDGASVSLEGEHKKSNSFSLTLTDQVFKSVDVSVRDIIDELMKDQSQLATVMEHCRLVPNDRETWYVGIVTRVHEAKILVSGERANGFGAGIKASLDIIGGAKAKTHSESSLAFESNGVVGVQLLVYPIREKTLRSTGFWNESIKKDCFVIQRQPAFITGTGSAKQLRWDPGCDKVSVDIVNGKPLSIFARLRARLTVLIQFAIKAVLVIGLLWMVFLLVDNYVLAWFRDDEPKVPLWKRQLGAIMEEYFEACADIQIT